MIPKDYMSCIFYRWNFQETFYHNIFWISLMNFFFYRTSGIKTLSAECNFRYQTQKIRLLFYRMPFIENWNNFFYCNISYYMFLSSDLSFSYKWAYPDFYCISFLDISEHKSCASSSSFYYLVKTPFSEWKMRKMK